MAITLKYIGELFFFFFFYFSIVYFLTNRVKFLTDNFIFTTCLEDPTYMIRAVPSNGSDNIYCTLLAHCAVHGAMAGYTGFTVGLVNGKHAYIPFHVSFLSSPATFISDFNLKFKWIRESGYTFDSINNCFLSMFLKKLGLNLQ